MHATIRAAAVAAAMTMSIQPCLAAQRLGPSGAGERQSAAFAGVRVRVPMGVANRERPSARLQLTTFHDYRDPGGVLVRSHRGAGMELGLDRAGRPSYHLAGRPVTGADQRLGLNGSGTTWIVIGGVLLLVVVLAVVASAQPTAGPPEGAFD